jgi:hypothetical protein
MKSSTSVWEILAHEWARECLDPLARDSLAKAISDCLIEK